MTKAFIHIGMDKTGSTSLQGVCAQSRDVLADHGVCYPKCAGMFPSHHAEFAALHGFGRQSRATQADSDGAWSIMEGTEPSGGPTLLLSSEHFCYGTTPATIGRLQQWLARHGFDDVQIVVLLRDQVGWLVSAYGESIKWGNKGSIEAFHSTSQPELKYSTLLDKWGKVFGRDRLTVINYDRSKDRLVDAFFAAIGLDESVRATLAATKSHLDNSFSCQILLDALRRLALPIPVPELYAFVFEVYSKVQARQLKSLYHSRIWRIPAAFEAAAPALDADNAAIAAAYNMPPFPPQARRARTYNDSVRAVSDADITFAANLLMLQGGQPGSRQARPPGMLDQPTMRQRLEQLSGRPAAG